MTLHTPAMTTSIFDDFGSVYDRVLHAQSVQDLATITGDFARRLGFKFHAYAVKLQEPVVSKRCSYNYFQDFPGEWGASYATLNTTTVERRDPRILLARTGLPAISWNARGQFGYLQPFPDILRQARRLVGVVGDLGFSSGITIPSWAPGVDWSFAAFTTDATFDLRELAPTISPTVYFVSCLQSRVNQLLDHTHEMATLSQREREVLCWSAIGKTSWETSVILGISERTVNFHLQRAAHKLQVKGRRAACARAMALRLIAL